MRKYYTRKNTTNALGYKKTCQNCGVPFWAAKPDAKYHAPKCRVAAHRKKVAAKRQDELDKAARRKAVADEKTMDKLREKLEADASARKTNRPKRPPVTHRG